MHKLHFLMLALSVSGLSPASEMPIIPRNMNEKVEMISIDSGLGKVELETTLFSPPGAGPFPLVVINHGKAAGNPRFDPRARYPVASREFLKRGYIVAVPMRSGFSKSGGTYISSGCNTESTGRMQAEDILRVLDKLLERPEVDSGRVLIVGQSYGGISSIAAGSSLPASVRGIVNFAGGIRHTGSDCLGWERAMVDAFAAYGKEARIPSLWFYGNNDSYWGMDLPKRAHQAYQAAGGKARLISYGVFNGGDAHSMFSSSRGVSIWWPETEKFLNEVGLPTEIVFDVEVTPRPPKTGFAAIQDVGGVPYLKEKGRENYTKFLTMPHPRAFAIANTGNHGWAFEGADPLDRALNNCASTAKKPCRLYAVDDDVVWRPVQESK